ncbi:bis(5'-nucleosyl)-tetraphosphatase (symmetrical) YqeK [Tissierella pigra]|uniref:bis(5'-nucleosyl)-tetraphosphatase (symmetrical) YqeK n=1 Tax=Tissierella pigra TaxID=2607614 RepID=UPI001C0FC1CD|nr:bis(5'-nucleosyl)-tetraphosphatase (symmetrical) YqeK [Tissierella pigra]MBU5427196.1 bis(5'-nucleosyl)-tetraphosphatase (symmetrical) YqeK [Tissierella pigra]
MDKQLKESLIEDIGEKRYNHSLRVMETAIDLGQKYCTDIDKIKIAAILHDCGKFIDRENLLKMAYDFGIIVDTCMEHNPELIHGPLGSKIAEKKYKIKDREILESICYHTTGRENMTILDKIVYIADYIEPCRNFPGVEEIRNLAFKDLDKSILLAMEKTIIFLIGENKIIHPDTVKARNFLVIKSNKLS